MTDLLLALCYLYFAMSHQSQLNSLDDNQQTRLQCKKYYGIFYGFFVLFCYTAIDEATHKFITYPYYFIFDVAFDALATGGDSSNNRSNKMNATPKVRYPLLSF